MENGKWPYVQKSPADFGLPQNTCKRSSHFWKFRENLGGPICSTTLLLFGLGLVLSVPLLVEGSFASCNWQVHKQVQKHNKHWGARHLFFVRILIEWTRRNDLKKKKEHSAPTLVLFFALLFFVFSFLFCFFVISLKKKKEENNKGTREKQRETSKVSKKKLIMFDMTHKSLHSRS